MTNEEIARVVGEELQEVLALASPPTRDARLVDDLYADSLDLVEVVERVEARVASAGVTVRVPEEELRVVATVDEAVQAVVMAIRAAGGAR